jgi:copper chaperone NosL
MKKNILKNWMRVTLAMCAIALLSVLVLPIWQIQLQAPQYPEGLVLLIYANKLAGSVDIINGLNHYIGMKTLHADDFVEFSVLRYIIAAYALLFIVTAIAGKRKLLYTTFIAFVIFGIVAMVDFWKWEYNYGHNLDPDAAIKVPGMAYQPPLIGYKQLLNFGAYSIPDAGGWIFVGVGIILFVLVALELKKIKTKKPVAYSSKKAAAVLSVMFIGISLVSCNVKPQAFQLGKDNCYFCKMTVSDPRFGAEIITQKGKIYKFDDVHCLLAFMKSGERASKEIKDVYFVAFNGNHGLIKSQEASLLQSEELHSPMRGNVAAFANANVLRETMDKIKGVPVNWEALMLK